MPNSRRNILQISSDHKTLCIDLTTGLLIEPPDDSPENKFYLGSLHIAPAFLELQINGCAGFHFTRLEESNHVRELERVSRYLVKNGVGGFWATVPTVSGEVFRKVCYSFQVPRKV